jgi:ABC-type glycerol-3-phosphate transport system permease component
VPGLISAFIFCFTLCGNEFIYALTFISSIQNKTVPVAIVNGFCRRATLHGFVLFLSAALLGFSTNIGITLIGVLALGLPPLAAKLAGIATAFLANFLVNLHIVFRTRS